MLLHCARQKKTQKDRQRCSDCSKGHCFFFLSLEGSMLCFNSITVIFIEFTTMCLMLLGHKSLVIDTWTCFNRPSSPCSRRTKTEAHRIQSKIIKKHNHVKFWPQKYNLTFYLHCYSHTFLKLFDDFILLV